MAVACGAPTAQLVQPDNSPISFEVPADYNEVSDDLEDSSGLVFAAPGTRFSGPINEPVVQVQALANGENASFKVLRTLATGGEFDPLDRELEVLPNNTEVLTYDEISDAHVWGIRMRMFVGQSATDFQALVDRQTNQVVLSQLYCTQACFLAEIEMIDEIQASWAVE